MDKFERAMAGGAMSWAGESEPVGHRDALWLIAGIVVPVVIMLLAVWALSEIQSSGEAPAFECRPGETYTTKECR